MFALTKFGSTRAALARRETVNVAHLQPMGVQAVGQFRRFDEHVPIVDGDIDESRESPLLHDLDGEQLARPGSVDGVEQEDALRLQRSGDFADHTVEIRHVLEHVAAEGKIELTA